MGLRRGEEGGGASFGKALLTGLVAGGLAGGLGVLYLKTADLVPALHILKENTLKASADLGNPLWLIGLCVLASPLFEEFIFHGLVFRGLRRSTGPLLAVLGSAGIFAVVHPPFSVIPVFVLGAFAAMSFERTRLLWAPIATHMVYNAIILAANAKIGLLRN